KIKPIIFGVVLWILIVILVSIQALIFPIQDAGIWSPVPLTIHFVTVILAVLVMSFWYYKSSEKPNGFLLGFIWLVIDLILESAITIPMFVLPSGQTHLSYFFRWDLLVDFAIIVITPGIYRLAKKR
ncbi:hypothetical protein N836_31295, partial [Leptolyngbya sp. Heron Island J]